MGNRSSSHHPTSKQDISYSQSISAKVVHLDGQLEEYWRLVTVAEIVSGYPNCYLCSSDNMLINSYAPQLPTDHVLHFGQIYFLMPLSKSQTPLSLQDMCALAIKAHEAINISSGTFSNDDENKRLGFPNGGCRDIVTF